jgi:hypothetical protein
MRDDGECAPPLDFFLDAHRGAEVIRETGADKAGELSEEMIFHLTRAEYARRASSSKNHEASSKTSRSGFCFPLGFVVYQRLHDDE